MHGIIHCYHVSLYTHTLMFSVASPEIHEADRLQPIQVEYFGEHVKSMHENRDKRFEREYEVRVHCALMDMWLCVALY